ncbi:DUF4892 domain-containing protein [Marinobacter salinus]|uniref:DUF4892 domain-containing protein n=1 Tax=Marinobacter salinus TaxID=1874317 RepID=A0A1D9GRM1_9GAMM|nr:DUF4892 domain-containing protein [Marinobacter salinus]AOY90161.1 DUF4892 domain-containing protein [Marinobacter salinus]
MPEPFPQSTLELTKPISSPGHLVLFSPVREVNNEIRSETLARLPVTGEGRLYEIARDSSREKARDHYIRLLQGRGAQILYECTGIGCGRSNVWANQIFGQRELYGRDSGQDYLVAGTTADDGSRWLTLVYTVTRGNLREYVWVEHLEVGPGVTIPGLGSVDGRIHGPVIVPWQGGITYRFDWSATDRRKISEWAASDGAIVVLAGFSSLAEDETLEQSLARARQATESLSEVLAKTGVSGAQQKLIIVGPAIVFADPERQGDRVEVTVIAR